jgi:hypothetical protein
MNNVVTILIDSVMWECTGTKRTSKTTTPFMDSLHSEGITASELYSHGPYTDAATKSLYTGRNCLDDFSYFYRLNSAPNNHFKAFHDAGYETYGLYYPYFTIGNKIKEYIDHTFYSAGFIFKSEWGGIFSYYASIYKNRDLYENEVAILELRTKLMFECWLTFYKDVQESSESIFLIKDAISSNVIKDSYDTLYKEYELFLKSPLDYIKGILTDGLKHNLARLDSIDLNSIINHEKLKTEVYIKYKKLFNKFKKSNFKANIIKNAPSLRRLFWGASKYLKNRNIDECKFLANYYTCLFDIRRNINQSFKHWKDLPSARKHLNLATNIIKNRNRDKPFYLSIHVLDPHNYISFFSYDMLDDKSALSEEMQMLERFVDDIGTEYVGSLAYLLSIRYVDFCIEKFCNKLKEEGLWNNTTLLFIADHGSSYSFYPLHGARVNCFHDECYHIPMLIRSPGLDGRDIKGYYNSKDVYPTLFDVIGIKKPSSFTGHSMLDKSYTPKPYVITEYMGPGCPDMLSRPIWFSARDKKYIVAYKVGIYQNFDEGDLCEVYDLDNDPHAFYDIHDKIDKHKIQYLLEPLRTRFESVKVETYQYIENLKRHT